MRILLALPDPTDCTAIAAELRRHGCSVVACVDGLQALRHWRAERPGMVLLHTDLPGLDGYSVCRAIRVETLAPIVMISPRDDDDSVARGFDAGADDYVAPSTGRRQLIARLLAILRRPPHGLADDRAPAREIVTSTLRLDLESHEVSRGQLTTRLTSAEFGLLQLLATSEGRLVPTTRLMPSLGSRGGRSRDTVRSRIASIRRKLGMRDMDPDDICSIRGRGYLLQRPNQLAATSRAS